MHKSTNINLSYPENRLKIFNQTRNGSYLKLSHFLWDPREKGCKWPFLPKSAVQTSGHSWKTVRNMENLIRTLKKWQNERAWILHSSTCSQILTVLLRIWKDPPQSIVMYLRDGWNISSHELKLKLKYPWIRKLTLYLMVQIPRDFTKRCTETSNDFD